MAPPAACAAWTSFIAATGAAMRDAQHHGDLGPAPSPAAARARVEDRPDPAAERAAASARCVGGNRAARRPAPRRAGSGRSGPARHERAASQSAASSACWTISRSSSQTRGLNQNNAAAIRVSDQRRPVAPGDVRHLMGEDRVGLLGLVQRVGIDQDHRPPPAPAQRRGHRVGDHQPHAVRRRAARSNAASHSGQVTARASRVQRRSMKRPASSRPPTISSPPR